MNTFDVSPHPFLDNEDDGLAVNQELEEPVTVKGFAVTYDRKFNLGDSEILHAVADIWVKTRVPEGVAFDLHHAKERVRKMARENVRAQLVRQKGSDELVFLGLQPPLTGGADPICVRMVSVSLTYMVSLGNCQSVTPSFTDWADLRHVSGGSGELHIALLRMWQSLWTNVEDEISRAQGHGPTGNFYGYPLIPVEDLTTAGNAPAPKQNGHFGRRSAGSLLKAGGNTR